MKYFGGHHVRFWQDGRVATISGESKWPDLIRQSVRNYFAGWEYVPEFQLFLRGNRVFDSRTMQMISPDTSGLQRGVINLYQRPAYVPTGRILRPNNGFNYGQADPGTPFISFEGFWEGYTYYLMNPSEMDTGLRIGFYVSGSVGAGALMLAGGAVLVGGAAVGGAIGSAAVAGGGIGAAFGAGSAALSGQDVVSGGVIGGAAGLLGGAFSGVAGSGSLASLALAGGFGGGAEQGLLTALQGGSARDIALNAAMGFGMGFLTAGAIAAVPYIPAIARSTGAFARSAGAFARDFRTAWSQVNGKSVYLSMNGPFAQLGDTLREMAKMRGAPKGTFRRRDVWGRADTLDDHFRRHGGDFGATSADDYAQKAADFFQDAQRRGLPTKVDADGVVRVYDPATNSFGSYNPDGTTRTFFKPRRGIDYWNDQPGAAPWTPGQ